MFRRATVSDAEDIASIYNQAIRPGIFATSQSAPDTRSERLSWLREHHDPYPAFVYENEDDTVVAWCSLNKFSVRPEYMGIAEASGYVHENYRKMGIGKLMLGHLIEAANSFELRALFSRALERNIAAITNTVSFGFRRVALLHEISNIRDEWHNDVWFWKQLR
ncbi:GNAT family N-acetyltransferase [Bradyrhizobium sp. CW9]|uniref:GNAT family N-acetyltransferase n=1 Tax=Bradyrhizobium sp. CW9 TaxID=2782689 RepID=UPI001FF8B2B3|nr:GNAT family N-acetyltransferase [Bradyrhizobium sp. CW9]MCK1332499.1 GNAT family N-acetyltransferase [Bradyrhizobium sp. CW9]